jgi:RNA polymerase sigma-70 factor, ECF subfamily
MADIDKKYIRKYLRGDQEAFEMLYEKYKKQLYSYLNGLVPQHPQLANDLFQQTWIKAIDNLAKYNAKGIFFAWLSRIAHNLFIDYYRKSKFEISKDIELGYSKNTPQKEMEKKEFIADLKNKVLSLEVNQREVFMLRQRGVSFKEIADIQNVSINTVLGRMRYAVDKLREQLKDYL